MKLNCGPSSEEKYRAWFYRMTNWHRFFCLWPRRITGTNECRWLEYVERKGSYYGCHSGSYWEWEYRPLTS